MVKLFNVGITCVHFLFFFVGIVMIAARPFVSSSPRLAATSVLVCLVGWAYVRQDDLREAYHARDENLTQCIFDLFALHFSDFALFYDLLVQM